jgi:hypothetical protein
MKINHKFLLVVCLSLAVANIAAARESGMLLVGQARLSVMFWSVYDSRLFSSDGRYREGQRPLRLEIQYHRNVDASSLVRATGSEWQSQGMLHQNQEQWLHSLAGLLPDVKKGDVITIALDEDNLNSFFYNDVPLGSVADPAFGQQFLDIWLSPRTTRPELRRALIGQL